MKDQIEWPEGYTLPKGVKLGTPLRQFKNGILQELEALRKLRMAVGKMICHINQGDEHPKDLQQVKLFLSKAEKAESPLIRGPHGAV